MLMMKEFFDSEHGGVANRDANNGDFGMDELCRPRYRAERGTHGLHRQSLRVCGDCGGVLYRADCIRQQAVQRRAYERAQRKALVHGKRETTGRRTQI